MRKPDFQLPGYLRRWHMIWWKKWPKSRPNVYLHHILAPDPGQDMHDHPAWNITIVLRGWYLEATPSRWIANRPGRIRFRRAADPHRIVEVDEGGCWTLWIRGGHRRVWGFWAGARFGAHWVPHDEHDPKRGSYDQDELSGGQV